MDQAKGFWAELGTILRHGRQVWQLLSPRDRWRLRLALAVMLLAAAATNAIPVLLGRLINAMQASRDRGAMAQEWPAIAGFYFAVIGAVFLAREGLQVVRKLLVQSTCTRIEKEMTVGVLSRLLRADLTALAAERLGSFHGRLMRSVEGFVKFIELTFMDFAPALFTVAIALAYAFYRAPVAGALMLAIVPVTLFLVVRQMQAQKDVRIDLLRSKEVLDGTIVEQLGGLEYVRVADTHRLEVQRVGRVAEERRGRQLRQKVGAALFDAVKAVNDWLFHLLVLGCAIVLAVGGRIEIGDILVFSYLFYNVLNPLKEVSRILDEAHESSLRVDDLMALLAQPVDRSFLHTQTTEPTILRRMAGPVPSEAEPPREPGLGGDVPVIAVRNLVVEYTAAGGERKAALDGVSLTIWPGQMVGIAGRSGSGKSTWLKVILRLAHPTWGTVSLGGVPVELVSREALGRLVGYVGQTPFLFAGTVAENIAYGRDGATEEDVRRAAELACIHDEVLALPGGYGARLAERGQNLSGGQRQRLALARVFLRNPPVLILDEGTSALDPISERNVGRAIAALRAERTVILVAHRLATLRDADRIFVFDAGRVVESGTYDELVRGGGAFAELARHGGAEGDGADLAAGEPGQLAGH